MIYRKHTICRTCPKWDGNTSNEPPLGYDGPTVDVKAVRQCNGSPQSFGSDINFLLNAALHTRASHVWNITQCEVKDGVPEEPKSQAQQPSQKPQHTATEQQQQQATVTQEKTAEQEKQKSYDPAEKALPPDVPNHHLNDGTTLEHLAKVLKYIFM